MVELVTNHIPAAIPIAAPAAHSHAPAGSQGSQATDTVSIWTAMADIEANKMSRPAQSPLTSIENNIARVNLKLDALDKDLTSIKGEALAAQDTHIVMLGSLEHLEKLGGSLATIKRDLIGIASTVTQLRKDIAVLRKQEAKIAAARATVGTEHTTMANHAIRTAIAA